MNGSFTEQKEQISNKHLKMLQAKNTTGYNFTITILAKVRTEVIMC